MLTCQEKFNLDIFTKAKVDPALRNVRWNWSEDRNYYQQFSDTRRNYVVGVRNLYELLELGNLSDRCSHHLGAIEEVGCEKFRVESTYIVVSD